MRSGTVAVVGRTNVGKSTFMNRVLGQHLAIVSPLPETTRDLLLGVWNSSAAQIAFVDTPGLHQPKSELGRSMNTQALDSARGADAIVFMTDQKATRRPRKRAQGGPHDDLVSEGDRDLLLLLPAAEVTPCLLVINKVDLIRDKSELLPVLARYQELHAFKALIPTSVLEPGGCERILDELVPLLPEGAADYDAATLTDQPTTFFIREYVREQILLSTAKEVPYAASVTLDHVESTKEKLFVQATIHVPKVGQRKILVGAKGSQIRNIGMGAREALEKLLGKKVRLELYVRVSPSSKYVPRDLTEPPYLAPPMRASAKES